MKNTCCVPCCESKRRNVKLHRIPKTEIGLKWVEGVNNDKLKELSLEELHKFFVCHNHFEKRFVTNSLRLRAFAYPTLFTKVEMNTGIPSTPREDSENLNIFHDHDYASRKRRHEDHAYAKPQPLRELQQTHDASTSSASKYYFKPAEQREDIQLKNLSESVLDTNVPPKNTTRIRIISRQKKCKQQYRKIINEHNKAKKQLNFKKRTKRAMKFSKKGNFDNMTKNLNPLARKLLWMQITQSTKHIKGWRFTDEEKMIALAIMKQSPKSYKFLRKIFILPSIRTINKMTSKLEVEAGVNPDIFNAIKTEVKNWDESKKYCSVIFDEVALESGLTYNNHKDSICGFVELENKTNAYADHALVFLAFLPHLHIP